MRILERESLIRIVQAVIKRVYHNGTAKYHEKHDGKIRRPGWAERFVHSRLPS